MSACGGDGSTGLGTSGPPSAVLIVSGQDQTYVVGKELTEPLEVKVVDAQNRPVVGQIVNAGSVGTKPLFFSTPAVPSMGVGAYLTITQ